MEWIACERQIHDSKFKKDILKIVCYESWNNPISMWHSNFAYARPLKAMYLCDYGKFLCFWTSNFITYLLCVHFIGCGIRWILHKGARPSYPNIVIQFMPMDDRSWIVGNFIVSFSQMSWKVHHQLSTPFKLEAPFLRELGVGKHFESCMLLLFVHTFSIWRSLWFSNHDTVIPYLSIMYLC